MVRCTHLTVRLTREDSWVRLQVMDTGVGIDPGLLPRLFTQGFTTRAHGHGTGLHSSALAAQLMGGRLTLESQGQGRGATATLLIPFLTTQEP